MDDGTRFVDPSLSRGVGCASSCGRCEGTLGLSVFLVSLSDRMTSAGEFFFLILFTDLWWRACFDGEGTRVC